MGKIYTKTGDRGTTTLFGGQRASKNSARIRAYGEVDELNSLIGVILADEMFVSLQGAQRQSNPGNEGDRQATLAMTEARKKLMRIQKELFVLGADLATPKEVKVKVPRITKSLITRLEKEIDKWSIFLPQLKKFILPGGSKAGSKLHLARTVARRAERSIVELSGQEKRRGLVSRKLEINPHAQIYINRLSDWLFTLARYINKLENVSEVSWKGRSKT